MRQPFAKSFNLACLGVAVTAFGSLNPPAKASGLTGNFAPGNWTLTRYIGGTIDTSYGFPDYQCSSTAGSPTPPPAPVPACVDIFDAGTATTPATFQVDGSLDLATTSPNQLINAAGAETIIDWSVTYNGVEPVIAKFNFKFDVSDTSNSVQAYFRVGSGTFVFDPFDPQPSDGSGVDILASNGDVFLPDRLFTINSGDTVSFGVYTNANTQGRIGTLTIGAFEVVPAPLPLLGAGAAFSWSRRLRRRVRARAGLASQ